MTGARAIMAGAFSLMLLSVVSACAWHGLRSGETGMQRLYIIGHAAHVEDREIIAAVHEYLDAGFFELKVKAIKASVAALPWVAEVHIGRRWPSGLVVRVREHRAVALWGQTGVLAADGTTFHPGERELPQGLPTLVGPQRAREKMSRLLPKLQKVLAPLEAGIARVHLAARGAWTVTLANGLALRLGRDHVIERALRFATFGPQAIGAALATAGYVDLRYDNGFAVGGKRTASKTALKEEKDEQAA